jgi:mannosyltransferase
MNAMSYKLKSKISAEFWIVLALFALALLARLFHLGVPSFCDDEISTTRRINHSLLDTILLMRHTSFPPLHYAILNIWTNAFGSSTEWALRFPSALFSGFTVVIIYYLGKELFNKSAGLISALLLIFSPFAINYAQNGKMYALYWFLTSLSFLIFFYFLKDQKKSAFVLYIFVSILCCYTMYMGFLILVTQSLIFLLMRKGVGLKQWLIGQAIIVSSCVPWFIYFANSRHEVFCPRPADAYFNYLAYFLRAFQFIVGNCYDFGGKANCFLYILLIAYLLFDVLTASFKNKNERPALLTNYYCAFIWLIVPLALYFMFDYYAVRSQLAERYIGFIQVPLILLVSAQITNLRSSLKKIVVVIMVLIAMNSTYLYFKNNLRIPEQDWRRTAQELTQELGDNDIVLSFVGLTMFGYYYKADMHKFFEMEEGDFSSEFLLKKNILTERVRSIFIVYEAQYPPKIKLDGFFLDDKFSSGASGFLHFQRNPPESNSGQ